MSLEQFDVSYIFIIVLIVTITVAATASFGITTTTSSQSTVFAKGYDSSAIFVFAIDSVLSTA